MSLKLSYVLPCYNVERYIADCLDSIYAQDVPEDEFEVICVNDCSTDGTRSIIVDYLQKHSNLTLIDHTENLTAGGARNTGISSARGEYIWFVDPDDLIVHKRAGIVYEAAKMNDVDVLLFNYEIVDEKKQFIKKDNSFSDSEVCGGQEFIVKYFSNDLSSLCIVWRCLFRTTFLKENSLWYPKMLKAEDVSFLWKVMLVADRVASEPEVYYVYRRNPFSIGKKDLDSRGLFCERVLFANEICKILECGGQNIKTVIRSDMERTMRWCVNSVFEIIKRMTRKEQGLFFDDIKSNRGIVRRLTPYMNRKQKQVFSIAEGKRLWLLKVRIMSSFNK